MLARLNERRQNPINRCREQEERHDEIRRRGDLIRDVCQFLNRDDRTERRRFDDIDHRVRDRWNRTRQGLWEDDVFESFPTWNPEGDTRLDLPFVDRMDGRAERFRDIRREVETESIDERLHAAQLDEARQSDVKNEQL